MASSRTHFAVAVFCAVMGLAVPALVFVLMFASQRGLSDPEALYDFAESKGAFTTDQMAVLSAGVRHVHARHFGSSVREVLFLLYPLSFLALSGLHLVLGVNAQISEAHQTPNKAPEPTPGAVTPRATEGSAK